MSIIFFVKEEYNILKSRQSSVCILHKEGGREAGTEKMWFVLRYFSRKIRAHHVDAYAAQAAFFLLLSAVPLVLLGLSLFRMLPIPAGTVFADWSGFFPPAVAEVLKQAIAELPGKDGSWLTSVSVLTVLWAASKSVYYLIGGLNSVFEVKEERGYLRVRLLAMVYTLALLFAVAGALVLMVFGDSLAERAAGCFPAVGELMRKLSSLRFFIGMLFLTGVFTAVYTFLPDRKASFFGQLPGALAASVGWMLFSLLFSVYVDRFADYTGLYGGLAAMAIFMLWLYVCMNILLIGGEINLLASRVKKL